MGIPFNADEVFEMAGNVAYKVVAVLVRHYVAVEVPGLYEIVVGVRISLASRLSGYLEGRLKRIRIRCRTTGAVGPVIRAGTAVVVNAHKSISLVAFIRCGFG